VFQVLEGANRELSIPDILAAWAADAHVPDAATVWRWLEDAVQAGRVIHSGTGRRNHPYRYWMAREAGVAGGDRQGDAQDRACGGPERGRHRVRPG